MERQFREKIGRKSREQIVKNRKLQRSKIKSDENGMKKLSHGNMSRQENGKNISVKMKGLTLYLDRQHEGLLKGSRAYKSKTICTPCFYWPIAFLIKLCYNTIVRAKIGTTNML